MAHDAAGAGAFGAGAFETGAIETGGGEFADDPGYDYIGLKEAYGLPDSLPPIRLPPFSDLAAQARKAPLCVQLAALAGWVGTAGRDVSENGDLTLPDMIEARGVLGLASDEDLAYLWEYAFAVEWVGYAAGPTDRVVPGVVAEAWDGDDQSVFDAWSATLGAMLADTIDLSGPMDPDDLPELGLDGVDFAGQPMALAVLLFLSRREGLPVTEFAGLLWEAALADVPDAQAAAARKTWVRYFGDPARLLLDKLAGLHALTITDDTIRLTPLGLAALHEQLVDAGVDIPLLPPTAAELSGAQLLAMAEGVDDAEFEAESDAWVAARGAGEAARELLQLAARGEPGERLLAVAAVTRIGPGAAPAWRASLDAPPLRGYAKVALLGLAGADPGQGPGGRPPELEPLPEDLAWMATDLLALACDDEFPDPDDLAASFREAVPPGREAALFDAMCRGVHPDAAAVLNHVGRYHPDKRIAKGARAAARKAASR